ncbi:MAG: FecR family protein [Methylophilaceae bacterium]
MTKLTAFILILVFSFSSISIAETEHVALFKNATGDLKIIRGQSEIVPTAGSHLFRSDIILTSKNSTCGIAFKDGTLLTVGPSSEVNISEYIFEPEEAKYNFSLYLKKGSAIYSSGKLGKLSPESVKVSTPKATVGVRGTRFIVKAD